MQASTLGSLEALLEFLRTSKIPVSRFFKFFLDFIYTGEAVVHSIFLGNNESVFPRIWVTTVQGKQGKLPEKFRQGKHREFGNFARTQGKHREFGLLKL